MSPVFGTRARSNRLYGMRNEMRISPAVTLCSSNDNSNNDHSNNNNNSSNDSDFTDGKGARLPGRGLQHHET